MSDGGGGNDGGGGRKNGHPNVEVAVLHMSASGTYNFASSASNCVTRSSVSVITAR